jgi:hypothetical protein
MVLKILLSESKIGFGMSSTNRSPHMEKDYRKNDIGNELMERALK